MKYLIIITSLILTSSTIAMDPYKQMLNNISNAAQGHPSITLINNSPITLCMEIGDLEKDNTKTRMFLRKKTQLTLSPYAHPFFLKKEHSKDGTIIQLFTKRPEENKENTQYIHLTIGGKSDIKFGDTIHLNYDAITLKITPEHVTKKVSKTLKLSRRSGSK